MGLSGCASRYSTGLEGFGDKISGATIRQSSKVSPFREIPSIAVGLFCAQPEHAISESYTTGATKNYASSGESKCRAKVRMTMDEDSRNPETDSQNYTQHAIHSTYV